MTFNSQQLIENLINRTKFCLNMAIEWEHLSAFELNYRTEPNSWNALECLQHLNFYGDYYLPEISRKLAASRFKSSTSFKSSWLGNYFADLMLPSEGQRKMNAFKSKNPLGSDLNQEVISSFIKQQKATLILLSEARDADLSKIKTGTTISKYVKIRLGDTLRVVVYHNERHVLQGMRMLQMATKQRASVS